MNIYIGEVILVISLSDAILIENFISFSNCHCQRQQQEYTIFLLVQTPLYVSNMSMQ
jgi:hypothetical protein